MKRIVVCCDGTWNKPKGPVDSTNVRKLCNAIAPVDPAGVAQCRWYHQGVGTGRWDRFLGGVFGYGITANIKDAYSFLIDQYEPGLPEQGGAGDEVYLFGFSRGAYTARSLAGLIRNCGILTPDKRGLLDYAYRLYRDRSPATGPDSPTAQEFRAANAHDVRITFIGVWDTVGALGIPLPQLRLLNAIARRNWAFHDVQLSSHVRHAVQSLAIDEKRRPFKPAIWAPAREPAPGEPGNELLDQAWFVGCHSDVGGGNTPADLSDRALAWMIDHARTAGLAFRPDTVPAAGDPAATPHESYGGIYRLWPRVHRILGHSSDLDGTVHRDPANPGASLDATQHLDGTVEAEHRALATYRPANLLTYLRDTDTTWPCGCPGQCSLTGSAPVG